MPDQFDHASSLTERELKDCIERARREVAEKPGPYLCMRCGETNTRRNGGWATCWDCNEAIQGMVFGPNG